MLGQKAEISRTGGRECGPPIFYVIRKEFDFQAVSERLDVLYHPILGNACTGKCEAAQPIFALRAPSRITSSGLSANLRISRIPDSRNWQRKRY